MKEKTRADILRLLAAVSISAFTYSAVLAVRTAIFGDDGGMACSLLFGFLMLAGFFLGRCIFREDVHYTSKIGNVPAVRFFMFNFNIKDPSRFIASLTAFITFPAPLLAVFLVSGRQGLWRLLFEALPALFVYFSAIKYSCREFSSIMTRGISYFGLVLMAVVLETTYLYRPLTHLRPYLFGIAYFYILAFLIMKNQEDIDSNIYSKRHIEKSILPRNMRSFNLKAVIVLFTVILVLFYLKPIIVFAMNILLKVSGFIIKLYFELMMLLFPDQKIDGGQAGQQQPLGFLGGVAEKVHPILNFISNIVMYFILLYAASWIIRLLARRLPVWAAALLKRLRGFFAWRWAKAVPESSDYSDEVETVRPDRSDRRRTIRDSLRNARRDLKHITDPSERVRYIYGSVLGMLEAFGIKPAKWETTSEILERARAINGVDGTLAPLTRIYDQVRYGSVAPDPESMSRAMEYFARTAELLRKT